MHVIYNDTCPICSREVGVYAREAESCGLDLTFHGLKTPARANAGLTRDKAARQFHVIEDGQLLTGVDAFVALWRVLPRWRWLARIVDLPVLRTLARVVYNRVLAPVLFAMDQRRRRRDNST